MFTPLRIEIIYIQKSFIDCLVKIPNSLKEPTRILWDIPWHKTPDLKWKNEFKNKLAFPRVFVVGALDAYECNLENFVANLCVEYIHTERCWRKESFYCVPRFPWNMHERQLRYGRNCMWIVAYCWIRWKRYYGIEILHIRREWARVWKSAWIWVFAIDSTHNSQWDIDQFWNKVLGKLLRSEHIGDFFENFPNNMATKMTDRSP